MLRHYRRNMPQYERSVARRRDTPGENVTQRRSYHNKWSKKFDVRPHRSRRRTVQSYSPGGANVPSNESTLAPPGEYD